MGILPAKRSPDRQIQRLCKMLEGTSELGTQIQAERLSLTHVDYSSDPAGLGSLFFTWMTWIVHVDKIEVITALF